MSDRILLVGEDFGNSEPRYHRDSYALTGASGLRLASLAYGPGEPKTLILRLCRDFDRTNVVTLAEDWKDRDLVAAGVARVLGRQAPYMVLLGARVAAAFGASKLAMFEWAPIDAAPGSLVARMAHPSGRSHWWNEAGNVERAADFMSSLVAGDV